MRTKTPWVGAALAVLLLLQPLAAVADEWFMFPVGFGIRPLDWGNGNKIVVGRFNTLHAVYQDGLIVKYTTSLDGYSWTTPVNVSGVTPAKFPSIGVDSLGNVGVVWVSSPGANDMGSIYYAYKPNASTVWTSGQLVTAGTEPAIVGRGTTMYVAFTSLQMAQYTAFPTLTPPPAMATGEILESTSCPNTGFRKPSITLVQAPCKPPVPRVAYLFYSDEQGNIDPTCQSLQTQIGPHVCQRNNTLGTWSMIYDDTRTDTAPASSVDPISLSLSANYTTGNTFLAWSDEQTGDARTKLAHGHGAVWDESLFESTRRHVHVRANGAATAPATEFRFAWNGLGTWIPGDEFFSSDTYYSTNTWTGLAPTLGSPNHLSDYGGFTGRPQAFFWKRCSSGQFYTTEAYYEAEGVCTSEFVSVESYQTSPCPPTTFPPIVAYPCKYLLAAVALVHVSGVLGTAVDTTELGVITRVSDRSATVTTSEGLTVTIAWRSGRVVSQSDYSLILTSPRSDVTLSSRDVKFEIQEVGYLREYDPSQMSREMGEQMGERCRSTSR